MAPLNVPWFQQETTFFCGPAVAKMFLSFFGVNVSQTVLWNEIKNNTGGSRPPSAPPTGHDFPSQVCENCQANKQLPPRWECWATTPEALQRTIAARTTAVTIGARYASSFEEATAMLIDSLDRTPAVPPFATLQLINHWIIVNGCVRDDFSSTEFPIQTVGKYHLNGVYILDPQQTDGVERVRLLPVAEWNDRLGLIGCGPREDTYPIVVADTHRFPLWVSVAVISLLSLLMVFLWRWLIEI